MLHDFERRAVSQLPRHTSPAPTRRLVEAVNGEHQRLEILNDPRYGNQLYIDGDLQISESDRIYGMAMAAPIIADGTCKHIAILGGGDGGVLRELLESTPAGAASSIETVTLVDIDANVIALSKRHLPTIAGGAFEDARARVIVGDAFDYIRRARGLDAVVCDLTMEPVGAGEAPLDYMASLLQHIANALRPGGILSLQAGEETRPGELDELRKLVGRTFVDVAEQRVFVPSYRGLWIFLAARKPDVAAPRRRVGHLVSAGSRDDKRASE